VLGATLPFAIRAAGFDPAHAGATIQVRHYKTCTYVHNAAADDWMDGLAYECLQVIMDISGVGITCFLCAMLLPDGDSGAVPPAEAIGDET